jgi:hypothetical protein
MVDYYSLPRPVVAPRIRDALELLGLDGVQWVPADVSVRPGDVRRYWLLHVYRELACIDREHSQLDVDEDDGAVLGIEKLVLDEQTLQEVPLERGGSPGSGVRRAGEGRRCSSECRGSGPWGPGAG